jgi:hypothetical protein
MRSRSRGRRDRRRPWRVGADGRLKMATRIAISSNGGSRAGSKSLGREVPSSHIRRSPQSGQPTKALAAGHLIGGRCGPSRLHTRFRREQSGTTGRRDRVGYRFVCIGVCGCRHVVGNEFPHPCAPAVGALPPSGALEGYRRSK